MGGVSGWWSPSGSVTVTANRLYAARGNFTSLPAGAWLHGQMVFLSQIAGSATLRVGVYADTGNTSTPGALLAQSESTTIEGYGWHYIPYITPVMVNGPLTLWMARLISNAASYATGGVTHRIATVTYSNGFPATGPSTGTTSAVMVGGLVWSEFQDPATAQPLTDVRLRQVGAKALVQGGDDARVRLRQVGMQALIQGGDDARVRLRQVGMQVLISRNENPTPAPKVRASASYLEAIINDGEPKLDFSGTFLDVVTGGGDAQIDYGGTYIEVIGSVTEVEGEVEQDLYFTGFQSEPPSFTNEETVQLVARMSSTPDYARRRLINRYIQRLKDGGVWDKLDLFYVFAAHDEQAARLNWKSSTLGGELTKIGNPTFTVNGHFKGMGGSLNANYLNTGLAFSQLQNYTQNNCHMLVHTASTQTAVRAGDMGGSNAYLSVEAGGAPIARPQTSAGVTFNGHTTLGQYGFTRSGSAGTEAWLVRDGAHVVTAGTASNSISGNIHILQADGWSAGLAEVTMASAGAHLTPEETAVLHDAHLEYINGVATNEVIDTPLSLRVSSTITLSGIPSEERFGTLEAVKPPSKDITLTEGIEAAQPAYGPLAFQSIDPDLPEGYLTLNGVPIFLLGQPLYLGIPGITLTGIPSEERFGTLEFDAGVQILTLSGFAEVNAFGALAFSDGSQSIELSGFSGEYRFGTLALQYEQSIFLESLIEQTDLFGVLTLQRRKQAGGNGGGNDPGGVGPGRKYASRVEMDGPGLITALQTTSSTNRSAATRMGIYEDVNGQPGRLLRQTAAKSSVLAGVNDYPVNPPFAVTQGFYWVALHSDGNFNWFLGNEPNGSRYNNDLFSDGISDPFGPSTSESKKAPVVIVFLEGYPTDIGVPSTISPDAFGTLSFGTALTLEGFAEANGFGATEFVGEQGFLLSGFKDAQAFGTLTFAPGPVTITLPGDDFPNRFGTLRLVPNTVTLTLAGIENTNSFGAIGFTLNIRTTGFREASQFGTTAFVPGPVEITLAALASGNGFGNLALVPGPVDLSLTGFSVPSEAYAVEFEPGAFNLYLEGIAATENTFDGITLIPGPVDLDLSGFKSPDRFGTVDAIIGVAFDWVPIPGWVLKGSTFQADVLRVKFAVGNGAIRYYADAYKPRAEVTVAKARFEADGNYKPFVGG